MAVFPGSAFRRTPSGSRTGRPYFGLSIARVDPLPHQLEAIDDYLLKLPRVRFLLADDAGAGKTIMSGLLIRELELRGLAERILAAPLGKEVIHSCVEIVAAVTQLAVAGARDGIAILLDPLAIDAVTSIVINTPFSLRVGRGIGVERVNLMRVNDVLRRAVLSRKEVSDISVADHRCLHSEQLVAG
jgi:hypothetical protein